MVIARSPICMPHDRESYTRGFPIVSPWVLHQLGSPSAALPARCAMAEANLQSTGGEMLLPAQGACTAKTRAVLAFFRASLSVRQCARAVGTPVLHAHPIKPAQPRKPRGRIRLCAQSRPPNDRNAPCCFGRARMCGGAGYEVICRNCAHLGAAAFVAAVQRSAHAAGSRTGDAARHFLPWRKRR